MADATLSLATFGDATLSADDLLARLAWLRALVRPRLGGTSGYYRNPTSELAAALPRGRRRRGALRCGLSGSTRSSGLPARITGFRRSADGVAVPTGMIDLHRKEVVIENDIGWQSEYAGGFCGGADAGGDEHGAGSGRRGSG